MLQDMPKANIWHANRLLSKVICKWLTPGMQISNAKRYAKGLTSGMPMADATSDAKYAKG
jgi:hypothetical protein